MGEVLTDGFSDRGSTPLISILRTKQALLYEAAKGCSKKAAQKIRGIIISKQRKPKS
jgi:hypothetical protein